MKLLKLQITKKKYLLYLGVFNGCKVYQVIRRATLKKGYWRSYFLVKKGNKTKRVFSSKRKRLLSEAFTSTLTNVVYHLTENTESVNYICKVDRYYVWEVWLLDSKDYIYSFFNSSNYIVIEDKEKVEELKAYFLIHRTYFR